MSSDSEPISTMISQMTGSNLSDGISEITQRDFRSALSHLPTSVAAVTTVDSDNNPIGVTIGSIVSISLEPQLVGFFLASTARTGASFATAEFFCVNVLNDQQEKISDQMSSPVGKRFADVEFEYSKNNTVIISGVHLLIDCRKVATHPVGDHDLIVGEPVLVQSNPDTKPLIYHKGQYHSI